MMKLKTALSAFVFRTTRGRRSALLLYSGVVTLLLLGASAMISARADESIDTFALADLLCVFVLGIALLVVAPAMVAAQVVEERRSGTLDLLRTAPLAPTMLAAGIVGGAPSALYLLCSGPLVLHVVAGLLHHYPLAVLPESLLVLGLGSVTLMLLAMLAALGASREGGGAMPMLVAGGLGIAALTAASMASDVHMASWAFVHPAGALAQIYARFPGLYASTFVGDSRLERMADSRAWAWLTAEPLFASLAYALGAFLLLVAGRRALAEDPPAQLTKGEALALFSLSCVALLVPLCATVSPDETERGTLELLALLLAAPYAACVIGATPNAAAYATGDSKWMSDRGSPFLVAVLMVAICAGTLTVLFGPFVWFVVLSQHCVVPFVLVALTLPVYSLFAATRITTPGGRIAFWAMLMVHFVLQAAVWIFICDGHLGDDNVGVVLAELGAAFGVLLPLFVVWRQRVGDRLRAAA